MRRPAAPGGRRVRRRDDVERPRGTSVGLGAHYDPEAFGRFSEGIARYFGTARFLAIQTVIVACWLALNTIGLIHHWDPYPFILLNLLFSTQAAYAAPLILLAQNRQDARDRDNTERDREVAARTQADTEYLARELAAMRLALAGMATTDDLLASFERLEQTIEGVAKRLERLTALAGGDDGATADAEATTAPS
jgi:uncharacterized membrane protein